MTTSPHTIHSLTPILATPFYPDGSLDVTSLRRLVEFQLDSGVDGVAVFGMASEAFALTGAEREKVLAEVTRIVDGAVPIVAGLAGTSIQTIVEEAKRVEAAGAACLMALPRSW